MYGSYEKSLLPKLTLTAFHLGAVLFVFWYVMLSGHAYFERMFNFTFWHGRGLRISITVACSIVYFLRFCFTLFFIMNRKIEWKEAFVVAAWVITIHLFYSTLTLTNPDSAELWVFIGLFLYLIGSYINTTSELLRSIWKSDPRNFDQLYTGGLFKYSMHINYFGDLVLFTGFAMITGTLYAFIIPVLMFFYLAFINIPELDEYLAKKYPLAFPEYCRKTKKLIPFIW